MTHASESTESCHDTIGPQGGDGVTKRVGRGTARQTIRIDQEIWDEFETLATRMGTDRSSLIRNYVLWMLRHEKGQTPRRPGVEESAE